MEDEQSTLEEQPPTQEDDHQSRQEDDQQPTQEDEQQPTQEDDQQPTQEDEQPAQQPPQEEKSHKKKRQQSLLINEEALLQTIKRKEEELKVEKKKSTKTKKDPVKQAQKEAETNRRAGGRVGSKCTLVTIDATYMGMFTMDDKFITFCGREEHRTDPLEEKYDEKQKRLKAQQERGETSTSPTLSSTVPPVMTPPKPQLREKILEVDISKIGFALCRHYCLLDNALEIFLSAKENYFFSFPSIPQAETADGKGVNGTKVRLEYYKLICKLQKIPFHKGGEIKLMKYSITKQWQRKVIGNYEYLLHLNQVAGRSYSDLQQYPVFPWVLTDYTSDTIDLTDPAVYRDFSKPVGMLNPERFEDTFKPRYEALAEGMDMPTGEDGDMSVPPFHYGTHYSTAGIVLYYLVRQQPYSSVACSLQGGKFDLADRLFNSIPEAWNMSLNNPSDVKELIPHFFSNPAFLKNVNNLDLGTRQDGVKVDDVVLPPWASTAEEFIKINRAALESDYTSEHLHEWIDLIFGNKQQGRAAEEAGNTFYYLSYKGAVDIDEITDPAVRQVAHTYPHT